MSLITSRYYSGAPAPFLALASPWLLQGALLICATHGHVPFTGQAGTDFYTGGTSIISATALYFIRSAIWLGTMFVVMPISRSVSVLSRDRILLLLLPVLAAVSTLWSTAPRNTIAGAFGLLLLIVTAIYIGTALRPERQMQLMMITGVVAGVASLLMAGLFPSEGLDQGSHIGAVKGIFTHKNSCGFSMALLSTPAFFIRRVIRVNWLLVWSYGAFCVLLVVLSQSRTAWIDMISIVLLAMGLPLLRAFRSKDSVVIGGFVFLCAVFFGYVAYANMDTILAFMGKDPTFSNRAVVWQAVFAAILKRPLLGYGYLAFFSSLSAGAGSIATTTHFIVNHPHNGYLYIWLNLGLLGLALFSVIVFKAASNIWTAWRGNPYTDWYICLIVLMLVENLSEIGLVMTDDLSWLMFVVACVGLHHAAHPGVVQARSQVEPLVLALQAG
jgi:O-antigen ligase